MAEIKEKKEYGWKLDNSYARLPNRLYTCLNPTPVPSPKLIVLNKKLAKDLELNIEELQSDEGIDIFAGNKIPKGSMPLAQAYAGHQFGYFTMLGDGRALLLGEQITSKGNGLISNLRDLVERHIQEVVMVEQHLGQC